MWKPVPSCDLVTIGWSPLSDFIYRLKKSSYSLEDLAKISRTPSYKPGKHSHQPASLMCLQQPHPQNLFIWLTFNFL